jgi:hypothetical protein
VLRIDPVSGRVTAKHFPASARIDSIVFGYGKVWVLSSKAATLYKIDPRTVRLVGKPRVVAHSRATRPEILHGGDVWVRTVDGAAYNVGVPPSEGFLGSGGGPPGREEYLGQQGSLWWYDSPYGVVSRQEGFFGRIHRIPVTRFGGALLDRYPAWRHHDHGPILPKGGGPCLTSMVEGVESYWVTVAPLHGSRCTR